MPMISGSGHFRFQYEPTKLQLPPGARLKNAHGLVVDDDGALILTYERSSTDDAHCLARWRADDGYTEGVAFGPVGVMCSGTPHGLRLAHEAGTPFLYHVNVREKPLKPTPSSKALGLVEPHGTKMTLDGTILWTITGPPRSDVRGFLPFKPTWFAAPPGSPYVYLSDGYGSCNVHAYTARDGAYTGYSFGGGHGFGKSCRGCTAAGRFNNPHAVNWDSRVRKLVVSDRRNKRHQYFDIVIPSRNQEALTRERESPARWSLRRGHSSASAQQAAAAAAASETADARMEALVPPNATFSSMFTIPELAAPNHLRVAPDGTHAVVADLLGPVAILDGRNSLVSLVNVSGLLGAEGHEHPHDALMLPNGDLVVGTWSPGRLSYWRWLG